MLAKVVDASALGALLFGEPEGAAVARRLREASLLAPALLPFEVASVCLKKMRRHPDRRDALMLAFGMLDQMEVDLALVDHGEVLSLAERSGLTAYDASYLWLARRTGSELVTSTGSWRRPRQRDCDGGRRARGRPPDAPSSLVACNAAGRARIL
jgi:predicted nucleic acid-binding protein